MIGQKYNTQKSILSIFVACLLVVGLMLPVSTAYADPKEDAQRALGELNSMQEELDAASNFYYETQVQLEEAQKRVKEAEAQIAEANAKIESCQTQLGERARAMYRSGSTSFLDVFLGATTFKEFANNWEILDSLNEKDAALVEETKQARAQVEAAKAEAEAQAKVAEEQAAEAKRIKEQAEATQAQIVSVYASLSAEAIAAMSDEEAAQALADQEAAVKAIQSGSHVSSYSTYRPNTPINNNKKQTVDADTVIARAKSKLGKPYVWGATGPDSFDCSGLVGYALTGSTKRIATTQGIGMWTRVSNPKPGDICVYHDYSSSKGHTGIYIGNGQMIHAPHTGDVVKIGAVQPRMWYVRY